MTRRKHFRVRSRIYVIAVFGLIAVVASDAALEMGERPLLTHASVVNHIGPSGIQFPFMHKTNA